MKKACNVARGQLPEHWLLSVTEPEDTQQNCCEGLGRWGFYLLLCLFGAGGPSGPCLVQTLWWKRKSGDKGSGSASVHAWYRNSLILFVCQVRSFQL